MALLATTWQWLHQNELDIRSWDQWAAQGNFEAQHLAIVGNAGYLSRLSQGRRIDAQDYVLRMNNFVTEGFQRQVGKRTDLWMTSFFEDICLTRPELRTVADIFCSVPFNFMRGSGERRLNQRHALAIGRGLRHLDRQTAYVPSLAFFEHYRQELGRYPTTGAMAILLACQLLIPLGMSVYVTGFSFFQGQSHYYSPEQVRVRNHDLQRERLLLQKVVAPHCDSGRLEIDPFMGEYLESGTPTWRGRAAA